MDKRIHISSHTELGGCLSSVLHNISADVVWCYYWEQMKFTSAIQMKGLVIRVIADNNLGLHFRAWGVQPAPPFPFPVLSAVAINRVLLWGIPHCLPLLRQLLTLNMAPRELEEAVTWIWAAMGMMV